MQVDFGKIGKGQKIELVSPPEKVKEKEYYVRFVVSNNHLEFSRDLWEEYFSNVEEIELELIDIYDDENKELCLSLKGYKRKTTTKNRFEVKTKSTGKSKTIRYYLNLNSGTFESINKGLIAKRGGTKSRRYNIKDGFKSIEDNVAIVDFSDKSTLTRNSKSRKKKSETTTEIEINTEVSPSNGNNNE